MHANEEVGLDWYVEGCRELTEHPCPSWGSLMVLRWGSKVGRALGEAEECHHQPGVVHGRARQQPVPPVAPVGVAAGRELPDRVPGGGAGTTVGPGPGRRDAV